VDTGHNFFEVIEFRDRVVASLGERLVVATGHNRNGILLAPITAERVAELVGAG
jgi:glycine/D-amino acid oxidase-like deaminating enzyme